MATLDIEIASRTYSIACRDGEEPHLRTLAALVDRKARDAAQALGNMGEARHLLFASLLLADELLEARQGKNGGAPIVAADPAIADALEKLAGRFEALAETLERDAPDT